MVFPLPTQCRYRFTAYLAGAQHLFSCCMTVLCCWPCVFYWLSKNINCMETKDIFNTNINKHRICVNKLYYQQTSQQVSLIHVYRRLLQHVLAISYSHIQGAPIYKECVWSWNVAFLAVNGKIHCNCIITICMCGVDNIHILKLYRTQNH
jgi:hypothetical protein